MSGTDIGGFWAALGLKIDQDSFDKAGRAIDNTSNSLNHLITTLKAAATAMGIDKLSAMESQELYTAEAIGINAEELDKWQIAASLAGAKANGLAQALGKLNNAYQDTKRGVVNESMAKDLSQLGLNWNSLEGLNAGERMKSILDAASGMEDQGLALRLVNSLLGSDGQQLYQFMMKNYGGSVEQLLQKSTLLDFTTEDSKQNSEAFQKELNELKSTITEIAKLGIGELAGPLTEIVKPLNDWLQSHGTEISDAMHTLGTSLESIINYFKTKDEKQAELFSSRTEAGNALVEDKKARRDKTTGRYLYNSLSEETKQKVAENPQAYSAWLDYTPGASMMEDLKYDFLGTIGRWIMDGQNILNSGGYGIQDGIISPSGQVTQVAPDDWVIAAKDLSNIGAAFMPQTTQSAGDVILNQTINVSGGVNPATVRQQAYVGARGGLLEAIEQSTQRFQLMPQTR